jgi:hypothetical protein
MLQVSLTNSEQAAAGPPWTGAWVNPAGYPIAGGEGYHGGDAFATGAGSGGFADKNSGPPALRQRTTAHPPQPGITPSTIKPR